MNLLNHLLKRNLRNVIMSYLKNMKTLMNNTHIMKKMMENLRNNGKQQGALLI